MYDPFAAFKKHVLRNGLEVHHCYEDRAWLNVAAVNFTGAGEDPAEFLGLTHLIEHLVTNNVPGWDLMSMKTFFESLGGARYSGQTSLTSNSYGFKTSISEDALRKAFGLYGHMLLGAKIEREIEREKEVICREFTRYFPNEIEREWQATGYRSLFQGHYLAEHWHPIGRKEKFMRAEKGDIQSFYDAHFTPANTALVVLGGIDAERLLALLEDSPFSQQKSGSRIAVAPFEKLQPPTETMLDVRYSDFIKGSKRNHTEFSVGWPFPRRFPVEALEVFQAVVRDILHQEIREKRRLSYAPTFGFGTLKDIRVVTFEADVSPTSSDDISSLVQACIREAANRRDLFDHHRKCLINGVSMGDYSGKKICDLCVRDLVFDGRIVTMEESLRQRQKVVFGQMAEVAGLLVPEKGFSAIVRP